MKNDNFNNPDLLMDLNYISKAGLNSEQLRILLFLAGQCSKCDLTEELGGQTVSSHIITYRLEHEEGFKPYTIRLTLKKLLDSNIIKHHENKNLYQLNPDCVWLPYDQDHPTSLDHESFEHLKNHF